jgi:starch synthase (maltosyl-transferring)
MPVIRVAFVITELEVGGAEQALVRLACGLDRNRFQPVVYSLAPLPPAGMDRLVQALTNVGIEVHSLEASRWWQFPAALRKLADHFGRQQPHIVQSFLFHANVVAALAARTAKVPHILLGIRVADPSWWRGRVERSRAHHASRVVCVSQAVADFCRERHQFPAGKLIVIPNGIDTAVVSSTPPADLTSLGVSPHRRALVFIGRLDHQKDPQWLLEIAQVALPKLPQHELLIVGDGPLRKLLEASASRGGFGDRVHFLLWRSDALTILAASDLLLLTSRYEGMPNVILEAMALAKPVIASRTQGVAELLGPLADEQTAPWRDTQGFVQRLIAMAGDPQRAAAVGVQNQSRAREEFSVAGTVDAYARLYEGLAGS